MITPSEPTTMSGSTLPPLSHEPSGLQWLLGLGPQGAFLPRRVVVRAPASTIYMGALQLQDATAKQEVEEKTAAPAPAPAPSRSSFR